jgi:hypothetical protein
LQDRSVPIEDPDGWNVEKLPSATSGDIGYQDCLFHGLAGIPVSREPTCFPQGGSTSDIVSQEGSEEHFQLPAKE